MGLVSRSPLLCTVVDPDDDAVLSAASMAFREQDAECEGWLSWMIMVLEVGIFLMLVSPVSMG